MSALRRSGRRSVHFLGEESSEIRTCFDGFGIFPPSRAAFVRHERQPNNNCMFVCGTCSPDSEWIWRRLSFSVAPRQIDAHSTRWKSADDEAWAHATPAFSKGWLWMGMVKSICEWERDLVWRGLIFQYSNLSIIFTWINFSLLCGTPFASISHLLGDQLPLYFGTPDSMDTFLSIIWYLAVDGTKKSFIVWSCSCNIQINNFWKTLFPNAHFVRVCFVLIGFRFSPFNIMHCMFLSDIFIRIWIKTSSPQQCWSYNFCFAIENPLFLSNWHAIELLPQGSTIKMRK